MTPPVITIIAAFALVMVVGPLALWIAGRLQPTYGWRGRHGDVAMRSGLAYLVAFNLVVSIPELLLRVPRALTPGLSPALVQGAGAVAMLLIGLVFLLRLEGAQGRTASRRLLAIWLAYHGLMLALPQFAIAVLSPAQDTGRAMAWLGLGPYARLGIGLVALALVPPAALRIGRAIRALAPDGAEARHLTLIAATVPALGATPFIWLYRLPGGWIEVVAAPVVVTWIGIAWIQAGAGRAVPPLGRQPRAPGAVWPLAVAAVALLALFQLVLRPGIAFF